MEQKLYQQMTVEEQLKYVTDLTQFCEEKLPVLEKLGDAWEMSHRKDMETGLRLMGAFAFARDFVDKATRYGDYAARVYRLRTYFDKIKDEVANGLSIKGSDGHTYALVAPSMPSRRRGRPSVAEVEARKNGIEMPKPTDPEMEKQLVIARLMGIDVVVSDKAPREKNNAEMAAEKAARQKEYEKQNPSLFPADTQQAEDVNGATAAPTPKAARQEAATQPAGNSDNGPLPCPTMSEIYTDRINSDRLHLSDIAWLCSEELKARIEQVRAQRTVFGSAAERAKLLAEQGAEAKVIEPYTRQAEEAREAFESTYAAVDEELAVQFKRLSIDLPYIDRFCRRFKGVDLEKVLHICRPYYEKTKKEDPSIDVRIQNAIERDDPEYAAKLKAEEEKKQEAADIIRYLKRKDKPASDVRLKSAKEVKFPRLVELIGEEEAKNFYPLIAYIEEENRKLHETESKEKAADQAVIQEERKEAKPKKPSVKRKAEKAKVTKKKDGQ